MNTPADPLRSHACVEQRCALIEKNRAALKARSCLTPSTPQEARPGCKVEEAESVET